MKKLSVIIPVYNMEKYLAACLDSVLNQTVRDIEIICVNDGSTDQSLNILQEYALKDPRITIINQANKGLAAARNTGMQVASGAYYAFVDSDDLLAPETYAVALKYIDKADLVCFGVQAFGKSSPKQQASDKAYYRIRFQGVQKLTDSVIFETDVSACNKIFKKDIIDTYHLTFQEGFYYEDAEFYCKYMSCAATAYFIPQYFYHYRRTPGSIMGHTFNGNNRAIDHLYHVKHIYNFWRKTGFLYSHKKLFEKYFASWLDFAYRNSRIEQRRIVMETAAEYAFEFNKVMRSKGSFMKELKRKRQRQAYGPKVTVLLPVYNAQKYVAEAIESILDQTFTDFEFIIINDGSTDGSAQIIECYKDPRIIFVNNPRNQGLVTVLNQGLDMAHGEYIARMDADDISLPNRLAQQVKFLDKHPKVGVLGTWFHIFGNIDRIEKNLKHPMLKDMIHGSPVGHPTVMFRKALFDKYQLRYDPAYKHAEDYELWTRVINHTQIANLQEVLLKYRWTGSNVSAVYEKEQLLVSEVIKQKIRKACQQKRYILNCSVDDSKLLNELENIEFHYMPNSGNMGDMLIAGATMKWFDKHHLKWQRVTPDMNQVDILVYGGGGA